jgi:hypothetical protein
MLCISCLKIVALIYFSPCFCSYRLVRAGQ